MSLSCVFVCVNTVDFRNPSSLPQAISTSGGGPGWIASNVNEAHLDFFFWTLLVLMVRLVWRQAAQPPDRPARQMQLGCPQFLSFPCFAWQAPCLTQTVICCTAHSHPLPPTSQHPPQFLNFLIFLRVSSCFRYRVLPHATVGVEALALTPDYKSGVGLTIAMSASERADWGDTVGCSVLHGPEERTLTIACGVLRAFDSQLLFEQAAAVPLQPCLPSSQPHFAHPAWMPRHSPPPQNPEWLWTCAPACCALPRCTTPFQRARCPPGVA